MTHYSVTKQHTQDQTFERPTPPKSYLIRAKGLPNPQPLPYPLSLHVVMKRYSPRGNTDALVVCWAHRLILRPKL